MALERLSLAPAALNAAAADTNNNAADDVAKAPRLPRWTRQEILVLIQGKRVAENRVRRGRTAVLAFGSGHVEPKWSSVSSYCKRHGVNRGPVQCRKRWSNLAGDFKKIKEWESQIKEEAESFWVMRNDLRRERKLPGFFDREVYDILDGGGPSSASPAADDRSLVLSLAPSAAEETDADVDVDVDADAEAETEVVFDSGRRAPENDRLFSEENLGVSDKDKDTVGASTIPIPETQYEPSSPQPPPQGTTQEQEATPTPTPNPVPSPETHRAERKRKRLATDAEPDANEDSSLQNQLIETIERNGKLLTSQLQLQNTNFQLDREQRNDHANSLFAVLNKLADAMVKIADKL